MASENVTLADVTDDFEKKVAIEKQKKEVIKKMSEISSIYGVDACVVMYSPNDPEPTVWPSHVGAHAVLTRYRSLPEIERTKRMVNPQTFAQKQMKKKQKRMEHLIFQCLAGKASLSDLFMYNPVEMHSVFNKLISELYYKMEARKISDDAVSASSGMAVEEVSDDEDVDEVDLLTDDDDEDDVED